MFNKSKKIEDLIEGNDTAGIKSVVSYKLLVKHIYSQGRLLVVAFLTIVILAVAVFVIAYLWINQEKTFIAYEFNSSGNQFYRIMQANETLTRSDANILFLLRSYVVSRHTIDHRTEQARFSGQVTNLSSQTVLEDFKNEIKKLEVAKLFNNQNFIRTININSSVIVGETKNTALITFDTVDVENGQKKINKWLASINYMFAEEYKKIEDLTFNPLGLYITGYSIGAVN